MFCLDAEQIEGTWQDYEHLIEQFSRKTGEMTAEQVKTAALASELQIWGLQDEDDVRGILCTEIVKTARGRVCMIRLACGEAPVKYQTGLLAEVASWAKSIDCVAVRIHGRKGWLKRFPCFRQTGIVAEWNLRTN